MNDSKKIKKVVKLLGLEESTPTTENDPITYDLVDDNGFGRVYVKLESTDNFEASDEHMKLDSKSASLKYFYGDDVEILLEGDFDNDVYKVVITEA